MKSISFKEFFNIIVEHRESLTQKQEYDMVFLLCGDEGSGKSMFSLALAGVDPHFYKNYMEHNAQIYFLWDHFLKGNMMVTKKTISGLKGKIDELDYNNLLSIYNVKDDFTK